MDKYSTMSLSDLMTLAYDLSLQICYSELDPGGHYFTPRATDCSTAWGYCDGLIHKQYEKIVRGRCSIRTWLEFDIGKFEQGVVQDIQEMKSVLAKLPKQITLTPDEMRKRGYVWE